jgi:DNA primase
MTMPAPWDALIAGCPSPVNNGNEHLRLLLSDAYPGSLAPAHLKDLRKSGLTDATLARQRIRSVPLTLLPRLLERDVPEIRSAYILPFPDPAGGWLDHVRLRIFDPFVDHRGRTVKYLGPAGAPPRLFFPLATIAEACDGDAPLWICEGVKKSLACAQLGLPAVAFEGIEAWHVRRSRALLADFNVLRLRGRRVELAPDGDVHDNPNVARGAQRLAEALEQRGALVRVVLLPARLEAAAV